MSKKFEKTGETFDEYKDMLKNLTIGNMDQSYTKLYRPWMDFMSESKGNISYISMSAVPDKYKEFYDDWMNTYQNSFRKFSQTQVPIPRETLEKLVMTAGESNKMCMSWVNEFGENAKKTIEVLNNDTDPAKYRECLTKWRQSYEKMSDDLLALPAVKFQKIFENLTGIPDFYSESFERIARLWKESYDKIYDPWFESMEKLSESMIKLSKGEVTPDEYKKFYDVWATTYKEMYGKLFDPFSMKHSKEAFEIFQESINISLNLYKGWFSALEKIAEKLKDLSRFNADPETFKEFFNLWLKIYEKATDDLFEGMPAVSPVKELMEPVKKVCKIFANTIMSILCSDSGTCTTKTIKA